VEVRHKSKQKPLRLEYHLEEHLEYACEPSYWSNQQAVDTTLIIVFGSLETLPINHYL